MDADSKAKLHLAGYLNICSVFFYLCDFAIYYFHDRHLYYRGDVAHTIYALLILFSAGLVAVSGILALRAKAWWLAFSGPVVGLSVLAFQIFTTQLNYYHWFRDFPWLREGSPSTLGLYPLNPGFYGSFLLGLGAFASTISARPDWPKWKRLLLATGAILVLIISAILSISIRFQSTTAIE